MATQTKYQTKEEWLKGTKADIRALDKKEATWFALRVTGLIVGTCPMTVGYIGKSEFMGKITYYACKELVCIFQSWGWHMVYNTDINAAIKAKKKGHMKENKILVTDSLTKAINFLKLDK